MKTYYHIICMRVVRGDDLTKLIITVHVSQLRADYLPGCLLEPQLRYRGGDGGCASTPGINEAEYYRRRRYP